MVVRLVIRFAPLAAAIATSVLLWIGGELATATFAAGMSVLIASFLANSGIKRPLSFPELFYGVLGFVSVGLGSIPWLLISCGSNEWGRICVNGSDGGISLTDPIVAFLVVSTFLAIFVLVVLLFSGSRVYLLVDNKYLEEKSKKSGILLILLIFICYGSLTSIGLMDSVNSADLRSLVLPILNQFLIVGVVTYCYVAVKMDKASPEEKKPKLPV